MKDKSEVLEAIGKELVLSSMAIWRKLGGAPTMQQRTEEQKAWDSAIFCASEYVRRRQNGDERLALELYTLLTPTEDKPHDSPRRIRSASRAD